MKRNQYVQILFLMLTLTIVPGQIQASVINFSGQLDSIQYDEGGAVYSETPLGTHFTGSIDDIAFSGYIDDGITNTPFGCCIAAGGLDILNDIVLSEEDATFLNAVLGSPKFSAGNAIDIVNIEGDTNTSSGGRIEIGLSYIFDASTFIDDNLSNYPFNAEDVELSLFFIFEEDNSGNDIYSAVGQLDPVPVPAAVWLLGSGLVGMIGLRRKMK